VKGNQDFGAEIYRSARHAVCKVPGHLRADAMQESLLGAVMADTRYDGRVEFRTFASKRMHGQVADFLRREDPLTRRQRKKVKAGEAASPIHVELAGMAHFLAAPPDQERRVLLGQLRERVECLPRKERRVLLYDLNDVPTGVIARKMRISASTVANLRHRAIRLLQRALGIECGRAA
jgi:RNA polymerase sigma factor (sigma-70 family)